MQTREEDLIERVAKLIHPQAWNDWQYREPNRTEWRQWARGVARKVIAEVRADAKGTEDTQSN